MSEPIDAAAVRADDAYVELIRTGQAPAGDVLGQTLVAWQAATNGRR